MKQKLINLTILALLILSSYLFLPPATALADTLIEQNVFCIGGDVTTESMGVDSGEYFPEITSRSEMYTTIHEASDASGTTFDLGQGIIVCPLEWENHQEEQWITRTGLIFDTDTILAPYIGEDNFAILYATITYTNSSSWEMTDGSAALMYTGILTGGTSDYGTIFSGSLVDWAYSTTPGTLYKTFDIPAGYIDPNADSYFGVLSADDFNGTEPIQASYPYNCVGYYPETLWGTWQLRIRIQYTAPLVNPSVTTLAATGIATTSGFMNGSLDTLGTDTSADVYFHWGTAPGTLINEEYVDSLAAPDDFTFQLIGLTTDVPIYYEAYAIGFVESGESWGDELTFTPTSTVSIIAITSNVSDFSWDTALLIGEIDYGGSEIINEGFVYDTVSHDNPGNKAPHETNYAYYWDCSNYYTADATISHWVANLLPDTIYYVRFGVDINPPGDWEYGDEVTFTITDNGYTLHEAINTDMGTCGGGGPS